jgi:hypothetical protein
MKPLIGIEDKILRWADEARIIAKDTNVRLRSREIIRVTWSQVFKKVTFFLVANVVLH